MNSFINKTYIFACAIALLLSMPTAHIQAKFKLPNTKTGKVTTAVALTGILYYLVTKAKTPQLKSNLLPVDTWFDYFKNAQIELKHNGNFNVILDEEGNPKMIKVIKYPAHGAGKIITFGEDCAKHLSNIVILPFLVFNEYGSKKLLTSLALLGLYEDAPIA